MRDINERTDRSVVVVRDINERTDWLVVVVRDINERTDWLVVVVRDMNETLARSPAHLTVGRGSHGSPAEPVP